MLSDTYHIGVNELLGDTPQDRFLPRADHRVLVEQSAAQAKYGELIRAELARLKIDPAILERLRGFALAANEGMLAEWAIATDLHAFTLPNEYGRGHAWQRWGREVWDTAVYPFLEHVGRRAGRDSPFRDYLRGHTLKRIQEINELPDYGLQRKIGASAARVIVSLGARPTEQ